MKKYILPLIIAFLSVHLLAQDKNQFNPVNTGVNSMGIAPDSRGGGMGAPNSGTRQSIRLLSAVPEWRFHILPGCVSW